MNRAILVIILSSTAFPALAQGMPGLEGDGAQTQSVELAKGTVSVSVDSQGSLSLGRGEDALSGGLGITVNGDSVELGRNSSYPGSAPSSTGKAIADPTTETRAPRQSSGTSAPGSTTTTTCASELPSAERLARALDGGLPVHIRQSTCAQGSQLVQSLLASQPDLIARIEHDNLSPERVVAITIDNAAVILDFSADSINH